jgi:HEPN domain-containing protein
MSPFLQVSEARKPISSAALKLAAVFAGMRLSISETIAWLCSRINRPLGRAPPEDKSYLRMMYFDAALHYHIAARYATTAWFVPASGNFVHHALEFYLKGALIEKLDEEASRKLGHNLKKLWRLYKRERKNPTLNKFDQTIRDINKFERIRYPEEIIRLGMLAEIGFVRNVPRLRPKPPAKSPPGERYELALDEADELVRLIFQLERMNPAFYINKLNEHAKRYLEHNNKFPMA